MTETWFQYAISDSKILGLVSWTGLLVTVAGFWLAIAQIRKVAEASAASADAVSKIIQVVRAQEQAAKIAAALEHLTSAQEVMKLHNLVAAVAHLKVGWHALMAARELTENTSDRDKLDGYVISTRRLIDDISSPHVADPAPAKALNQRNNELNKTVSGLGTMQAKLNTLLAGIGMSS